MTPLGLKSKKINCKFCDKSADYMKEYNDYFCSKCNRFQSEDIVTEVKLLPVFRLRNYTFSAQKYSYAIYNELGSRIANIERRDLGKVSPDKNYSIRYMMYNDVNRIIATADGSYNESINGQDGSWKVYDYGRNFRAEIKFIAESDTWQIFDSEGTLIAIRDPKDNKSLSESMRQYTFIDSNNAENTKFQLKRKGGSFKLSILDSYFEPSIAWTFILALHRKFYL
ncbi:MAG: hypothetical protein ACFFDW_06885 [Candidatus Thorarchaeota archaeon]